MGMFPNKSKPPAPVKPKLTRVTVSFDLTEAAERMFLTCSVERVINTSMTAIEHFKAEDLTDITEVNLQDWIECKPAVVSMWNVIRDAVFRQHNEMPPATQVFTLDQGVI